MYVWQVSPPETLQIERCMSKTCFIKYSLRHPGQDYSQLVNYFGELLYSITEQSNEVLR